MISCDYYVINSHKEHVGANLPKDDSFKACFEEKIFPYYYGRDNAQFTAGKDSLRTFFKNKYSSGGFENESGYITVRFIINCKGKAGRYEVLKTGTDFRAKDFDPYLEDHLLRLVKELKDWQAIAFHGDNYDSFFHLTFKIQNGQLVEILP